MSDTAETRVSLRIGLSTLPCDPRSNANMPISGAMPIPVASPKTSVCGMASTATWLLMICNLY